MEIIMLLLSIVMNSVQMNAVVEQQIDKIDQCETRIEMLTDEVNSLRTSLDSTYQGEVEYIECGTCGAHTAEWWFVTSDNGDLVPVCRYCYAIERGAYNEG